MKKGIDIGKKQILGEQEKRRKEAEEKPTDYVQQLSDYGKQINKIIRAEKERLLGKRSEVQALELVLNSCRELDSTIKSL
ncbi:unnamed protein product, partial [marine sediment metagenome]